MVNFKFCPIYMIKVYELTYVRITTYQFLFILSETLQKFPSGIGNDSKALVVPSKCCWIFIRNDEYVDIGSSLPALVITCDHLFREYWIGKKSWWWFHRNSIQDICEYYSDIKQMNDVYEPYLFPTTSSFQNDYIRNICYNLEYSLRSFKLAEEFSGKSIICTMNRV